jgi:AcrR family transcriptional regulator
MKPFERIAVDIRERIERGDIAVGDRVPSVREIAKKWKVASATAAHALRALADAGVVRSVPRVGNIVASPRARAVAQRDRASRDGELTRARIVEAAIAIADDEGLDALSLRGVAAKVGAPVMSLYRHVASKEELLREMTDAAFSEEMLPREVTGGWRARVEAAARSEWRVFKKHPWLARVVNLTRPEPLASSLAYADWMFRALGSTGADAKTQMRVHVVLHGFVQGIAVNIESEADATSATGMSDDEWMKQRMHAWDAAAASGKYPHFGKMLAELGDFDIDFDDLFERGLAALLDGFTKVLERHPKRARASSARK